MREYRSIRRRLEEALRDVKAGRIYTTEDVKKLN